MATHVELCFTWVGQFAFQRFHATPFCCTLSACDGLRLDRDPIDIPKTNARNLNNCELDLLVSGEQDNDRARIAVRLRSIRVVMHFLMP
jgi:hypothetical protein